MNIDSPFLRELIFHCINEMTTTMDRIEKSNVQEIFELSPVQKDMLYHYLREEEENLYNVQLVFNSSGTKMIPTLCPQRYYISFFRYQHVLIFSVVNVSNKMNVGMIFDFLLVGFSNGKK